MTEEVKQDEDSEEKAFLKAMASEETDADAPAESRNEDASTDESEETSEGTEEVEEREAQQSGADSQENTDDQSKDELREQVNKLQRALDTTNGRYGSELQNLRNQIAELTQQRQQKEQQAEQAEQKVEAKMSPDDFKRLKEEFPELAERLAEDLSEVLSNREANTSSPDLTALQNEFKQQLDGERQARVEELQQREIRMLKREHPDFNEVAGFKSDENGLIIWNNTEFGNWVARQPKEVQAEIINSNDAYTLSDLISEYKNTLKQKKQNNLQKAVNPKGVSGNRIPPGDPEEEAFKREMKREGAY